MLKQLRNRLLLINLFGLSVAVLLSLCVVYAVIYSHFQNMIDSRINSIPPDVITNAIISESEERNNAGFANPNGSEYPSYGTPNIIIDGDPVIPLDYSKSFVINIDKGGKLISVFSRINIDKQDYIIATNKALESGNFKGKIKVSGRNWQYLISGDGNAKSIVFLDIDDTMNMLHIFLVRLTAAGIAMLISIFIFSYYCAGRAIQPIAESMEKQRRFIADASHELKTPLAIIDSTVDAINADPLATVADQGKWLSRIEEESDRMNKLIARCLYLAKAEDAPQFYLPVDLSGIAEDEIQRVEAVLFEQHVTLELKKPPQDTITVRADAEKIGDAVLILLDNAVKYTDDGGTVIVEVYKSRNHGIIKVSNTGMPISEEDLPKLFDRFYRADKSRSTETKGYGLGLSIAKAIVERSGGHIFAASSENLNTFTIELPLI